MGRRTPQRTTRSSWPQPPYVDRLANAAQFKADVSGPPRREDLTTYHTLADSFLETFMAPFAKAFRRR